MSRTSQIEIDYDLRAQVEEIAAAMMASGTNLLEPLTQAEFKHRCARLGHSESERSEIWRAISLKLAGLSLRRIDD